VDADKRGLNAGPTLQLTLQELQLAGFEAELVTAPFHGATGDAAERAAHFAAAPLRTGRRTTGASVPAAAAEATGAPSSWGAIVAQAEGVPCGRRCSNDPQTAPATASVTAGSKTLGTMYAAFSCPSITGRVAAGPRLRRPRTAEPSVIRATEFR
jgi:hypothetical protein